MVESFSVLQHNSLPKPLLDYVDSYEDTAGTETLGGILSNTSYMWVSKGSRFAVLNSKTGRKIAAWTFGTLTGDLSAKVVCVDELKRPNRRFPLLIIGLECNLNEGMVCVFNVTSSRVLRAIRIDEKISSLQVVDSNYDLCPLPGPLRAFDNILALGTLGGNLFLLDLCCQSFEDVIYNTNTWDLRDESNPCLTATLYLKDIDSLEEHKQLTSRNAEHLLVHLNSALDNVTPHFVLKGPKWDDRIFVNREEVMVSSIHYCSQLGSLLIGYNFGAWQLWNLMNMKLVYTSPVYEENVPVSNFAVQEPCDDPRAFCYVWVIYSNTRQCASGFPIAVLYSLNHESKEFHEGYGILYQDFVSCSIRFQTDLDFITKFRSANNLKTAQCLRIQAINKNISKSNFLSQHHEETIAVCGMVWNCWNAKSEVQNVLILFDLNQWYKAQMPNVPTPKETNTYMMHVYLTDFVPTGNEKRPFLDARIDINTLSQFFGIQRLDEHYYPSSLEFNLTVLRERNYTLLKNRGIQRTLLSRLETGGALTLLRPKELCDKFIETGLVPLFVELPHTNVVSLGFQRSFLLNIALEQQLLGWLCRCASAWSNGSYASTDCTLDFLLSWGWDRAEALKQNVDKLCTTLFDYSGIRLDENSHNLLNNCSRQLKNLATLFNYVLEKYPHFLSNPEIIEQQKDILHVISMYLEVLQWLLNVGLLPECPLSFYPRSDDLDRISTPYPVETLKNYYAERRDELKSLREEKCSLLFIDNLIDIECGGHVLQRQWELDGGNGLYPPPSLQSLLRTYLIQNASTSAKHCIVMYIFLDLAVILDESRYKPIITHLIKFPAVFQLDSTVIKLTQAFWQLDHGDFANAMEQLLDPLIKTDTIKMWQHQTVVKSLLAQKQYEAALLYFQVRKPPFTALDDICSVISLYVVNNMFDEAFNFQRQYSNESKNSKILHHFYKECRGQGKLSRVKLLPLDSFEEKAFLNYLESVGDQESRRLQMNYYLGNCRMQDAIELFDKLPNRKPEHLGLQGLYNMDDQSLLLNPLDHHLPLVTRNFINCKKEKGPMWMEMDHPKPMSVFVHNVDEQIKYKSMFFQATMLKAKETWKRPVHDSTSKTELDNAPFINTPKSLRFASNPSTPSNYPIIKYPKEEDDEAPPSKKMRTSSGYTSSINLDVTARALSDKLSTPIIKRRAAVSTTNNEFPVGTPHSILKVRRLVSTPPESPEKSERKPLFETDSSKTPETSKGVTSSSPESTRLFGPSARKSLPRTPRPAVRFDISKDSDSSASNSSDETVFNPASLRISNEGPKILSNLQLSLPSDSSQSTSTFYSPSESVSNSPEKQSNETSKIKEELEENNQEAVNTESSMVDKQESPVGKVIKKSSLSRRSYKRSLPEEKDSPKDELCRRILRSSLLKRNLDAIDIVKDVTDDKKQEESNIKASSTAESENEPFKVKARRSLSKQYLENDVKSSETQKDVTNVQQSTAEESRNIALHEEVQVEIHTTNFSSIKYTVSTYDEESPQCEDENQDELMEVTVEDQAVEVNVVEKLEMIPNEDVCGYKEEEDIATCDSEQKEQIHVFEISDEIVIDKDISLHSSSSSEENDEGLEKNVESNVEITEKVEVENNQSLNSSSSSEESDNEEFEKKVESNVEITKPVEVEINQSLNSSSTSEENDNEEFEKNIECNVEITKPVEVDNNQSLNSSSSSEESDNEEFEKNIESNVEISEPVEAEFNQSLNSSSTSEENDNEQLEKNIESNVEITKPVEVDNNQSLNSSASSEESDNEEFEKNIESNVEISEPVEAEINQSLNSSSTSEESDNEVFEKNIDSNVEISEQLEVENNQAEKPLSNENEEVIELSDSDESANTNKTDDETGSDSESSNDSSEVSSAKRSPSKSDAYNTESNTSDSRNSEYEENVGCRLETIPEVTAEESENSNSSSQSSKESTSSDEQVPNSADGGNEECNIHNVTHEEVVAEVHQNAGEINEAVNEEYVNAESLEPVSDLLDETIESVFKQIEGKDLDQILDMSEVGPDVPTEDTFLNEALRKSLGRESHKSLSSLPARRTSTRLRSQDAVTENTEAETDVRERQSQSVQPEPANVRQLRRRSINLDSSPSTSKVEKTPELKRKRDESAEQPVQTEPVTTKRVLRSASAEPETSQMKPRTTRRALSVANDLDPIEEESGENSKLSKSNVDSFSKRVTRKQAEILKKREAGDANLVELNEDKISTPKRKKPNQPKSSKKSEDDIKDSVATRTRLRTKSTDSIESASSRTSKTRRNSQNPDENVVENILNPRRLRSRTRSLSAETMENSSTKPTKSESSKVAKESNQRKTKKEQTPRKQKK